MKNHGNPETTKTTKNTLRDTHWVPTDLLDVQIVLKWEGKGWLAKKCKAHETEKLTPNTALMIRAATLAVTCPS